jgi:arsenate reductase
MAAGVVHPRAIRAMREVGIDISRQTSKPIDVAFADRADAFVTLCGPVDGACPARVAKKAIDWPTADPTWGDDEEVRRVRDAIGLRVEELLREHGVLRQDTAHPA